MNNQEETAVYIYTLKYMKNQEETTVYKYPQVYGKPGGNSCYFGLIYRLI